jgi:hypothetical protein
LKTLTKYLGPFALSHYFFFLGSLACASSERAELQVPRVIRVESGTEADLPLNIAIKDTLYHQTMVVIRGIPSSVSLTAGRLFPSGVWAIKASAAGTTRLITSSNSQEDAPLIVSLLTFEGVNLGNATTQLVIAPAAPASKTSDLTTAAIPADTTPPLSAPPQDAAPAPAEQDAPQAASPGEKAIRILHPEDIDKILKLMERGDQHLLEGKIPSARRFYQLATEMGWPEGALAIARTYDADHLRRFPILGGITPDETLARDWYARARELSLRVRMRDRQFSGTQ